MDEYCDEIERTVEEYPSDPGIASQYVLDRTTGLFRQMCQCPDCGRLFIEDKNYKIFMFGKTDPECPMDLLAQQTRNQKD